MKTKNIGILTVATNKYIDYWKLLAQSIDKVVVGDKVTLHVFTDEPEIVIELRKHILNLEIVTYKIPNYQWPEATLFRYRIFRDHLKDISHDVLMHLDADMIVDSNFLEFLPNELVNGIALVKHPGYFRPAKIRLLKFYLNNSKYIFWDARSKFEIGAIGAWETNQLSRAFVPRSKRKSYVCGATWLGYNESFVKLVEELANLEVNDSRKNIIPIWHDESYLNWWNSNNKCTLLNPSFCYVDNYPQLENLSSHIRAIEKF